MVLVLDSSVLPPHLGAPPPAVAAQNKLFHSRFPPPAGAGPAFQPLVPPPAIIPGHYPPMYHHMQPHLQHPNIPSGKIIFIIITLFGSVLLQLATVGILLRDGHFTQLQKAEK